MQKSGIKRILVQLAETLSCILAN